MRFFASSLILIAILISSCAPQGTMTPTQTPSLTPDIDALIRGMSLEQKVGQVMIIGFDGPFVDAGLRAMVEKFNVGGVILFARNVQSPSQVANLTRELQTAAMQSGHPGLFVAIDQEGGRVARLTEDKGFTEFPGAKALGATGDPALARQAAVAMAAEMKAVGINIDFAPDLDVNNNFENPVIGIRSFGSNPQAVSRFGEAFAAGLQESGVLAFGKHFPGHGDTGTDSHIALPVVPHDRARLETIEFVPFKALMQAGVAGIMSAHVSFPAIDPLLPATLSPAVLTGLVRQEMGYDGLLVTDSLEMGALGQSGYPPAEAGARALQAGADLLLFNRDYSVHTDAIRLILERVRSGQIPESRLDEAVRRVLRAKAQFGLVQPALADPEKVSALVGTATNHRVAQDIAARSVTVLKDDLHLVPLPADAKLLVIETSAARGLGKAIGATFQQVSDQPSAAEIDQIVGLAKSGDRTVIVGTTDAQSNPAQAGLVNGLLKAGVRVMVIAMRGPYDLLAFRDVPTYLLTYGSPPPTLAALEAVLHGKVRPQGRLPVDIPQLFTIGSGE
jgi:beta-N-acetylhexosaminidase